MFNPIKFQSSSYQKHKKMKNFLTFSVFLVSMILAWGLTAGISRFSAPECKMLPAHCYISNPERSLDVLCPWLSPGRHDAAMAVTCPPSQTINLGPGQCGVIVPSFGFGLTPVTVTDLTNNQNQNTVTVNSTIYCSSGQTRYRRTFTHSGPTDMRIKQVQLGVYRAVNNPLVTFNFYSTGGQLYGTYTATISDMDRVVYSVNIPAGIDIKIPAQSSYVLEIVTNAPHISEFKIGRNNSGHLPTFGEASISADDCVTFNTEIWSGAPGITPNAVLFYVVGTPDQYKFDNILNDYEEGDYFPIGNTPLTYVVTDANGIASTCAFSINVVEFANPTGALACDDLVQVSLEDDCELIITPEMLLEGDQYGCYDNYTVQIIANNGLNLGNKVTSAQMGQKLKTQIIGPNGNSCWGEILVQDKLGPEFVCDDIFTNCASDLTPGSPVTEQIPVAAAIVDGSLSAGAANSKTFTISVGDFGEAVITDLDVFINVKHTNVSNLAANITSPDGVTVPLFLNIGCAGKDLIATFDDEATGFVQCEPTLTPAVAGRFRPTNPLDIFDGNPLAGEWKVTIFDLVSGDGGTVNDVHLIFEQEGAAIPFPTNNEVTFIHVNDNNYIVKGIDPCSDATLSYTDEIVQEDCASIYSKVIKRCWTGVDSKGNQAIPCCQFIYVYRNSLSTLVFPPNYDGLNGNPGPLSCFEYGTTVPPLEETGIPEGNFCDNVQIAEPEDHVIDICPYSYKLLRTHKVIEWCSGKVIIHNQIIKVMDTSGPELTCPSDLTISTDQYTCTATYKPALPQIESECSDNVEYELSYNYFNDNDDEFETENVDAVSGSVSGLNIGDNWIKWTVTDECGNVSECVIKVHVEDKVRPNAVCDQYTVTSITGNKKAVVDAFTFDDGSVDNCGIIKYEARKMTDKCGFGTANFTPTVEFCCEEVNTSVMVEMRVTDIYGNSNTCMVEVKVQDKLPPYITDCPDDIILDCQADYKDLTVTGEPVSVDNCEVVSTKFQDQVDINQCGVGTVTRTWTVEDKQGYKNSCVQVITLVDFDPFKESEIIWPKNYETKKCFSNLKPEDLPSGYDRPTFSDDNCSLVAAHYRDQTFRFVEGACEKVIRTWTVIDWCTYDESDPVYGEGWYEHIQIIKLLNDIPPQFVGPSNTTLDGCVDRTIPVYGNCEGPVEFDMYAIDDCPESNGDLVWKYELYTESGTTPIYVGNSFRFSRTLPVGSYRVRWTVQDKCGNNAYCTHNLDVIESKKPTPYCISSLTTAVMNSNGTISIWAKDYDKGAYDNCTDQEDLIFTFYGANPVDTLLDQQHYFMGDGVKATLADYNAGIAQQWIPEQNTSGILFDCGDIPNGISQEVSVEVWVTDLAGNQDYCTVTIVLQDNSNVCPNQNPGLIAISGRAAFNNQSVRGADVVLSSSQPEQQKTVKTDNAGNYSFGNLPKNVNYSIAMADNRNILNGVSTLDLVFIQRHILGLEQFIDPKKIIAADVDNNSKVTAADLVALRKNILGIAAEFPNGQKSWRFVTSNHTFADPANPFPYTEKYQYNQLTDNKVGQNFHAVKIGDVNNSAVANSDEPVNESRSAEFMQVQIAGVQGTKGSEVIVPVYADRFEKVLGYQFSMEFDPAVLEYLAAEKGDLDQDESNFGQSYTQEGVLTTAWYKDKAVSLEKGKTVFNLRFRLLQDVVLADPIKISSKVTPAVAYNTDYRALHVRTSETGQVSGGYALHQNVPNPFNELTSVSFELPEAGQVRLSFNDITGRTLKVINGIFAKGSHTLQISKAELGMTGVVLYKMECGTYSETRKMILIE